MRLLLKSCLCLHIPDSKIGPAPSLYTRQDYEKKISLESWNPWSPGDHNTTHFCSLIFPEYELCASCGTFFSTIPSGASQNSKISPHIDVTVSQSVFFLVIESLYVCCFRSAGVPGRSFPHFFTSFCPFINQRVCLFFPIFLAFSDFRVPQVEIPSNSFVFCYFCTWFRACYFLFFSFSGPVAAAGRNPHRIFRLFQFLHHGKVSSFSRPAGRKNLPHARKTRLRLIVDLRAAGRKKEENWDSPWFSRDHVAPGSSGLKPLRGRAPRLLSLLKQKRMPEGLLFFQKTPPQRNSVDSTIVMLRSSILPSVGVVVCAQDFSYQANTKERRSHESDSLAGHLED